MNTYSLLIWEMVPEEMHLYLIPTEIANKYRNYLEMAQNKMVNVGDYNDGLKFLNTALSGNKESAEVGFEEYVGVLVDFEKDVDKPLTGYTITEVYFSGFVL